MITFIDSKEKSKEVERTLDSQLWHACAGGMVQMPAVGAKVFYFPQGHAEHACNPVDFRNCPRIPAYVPCRVSSIKFMADPDTDEVFARVRLVPVTGGEPDFEEDRICGAPGSEGHEKPASFAKTLTQSDANNGGGFSVPRYCAETIFPRLDYSADPPVQTILAKDVHGETWKFRHIYRGTPRRHLLTTGWSSFVSHKKLLAGDSIVFMRVANGDLCVGIRRAKMGTDGNGVESASGWNPVGGNCPVPYGGGFSTFFREDENNLMINGSCHYGNSKKTVTSSSKRNVTPDAVIEAAMFATKGNPFEVLYYPRSSTPEFCVRSSLVKAATQKRWCSGMRFKMPFETEDSSRISWFMGTISSVQVADPIRWPDSPWRLLQVAWDEPDLLQNVKRVSPWLVELVSNMPSIHLSPFSVPRKKLRLPHHSEFSLDGQFPLPQFSGNHIFGTNSPFSCIADTRPAGMQGARHAHYGLSLPDLRVNKFHSGHLATGFPRLDHAAIRTPARNGAMLCKSGSGDSISCFLSTSHSGKNLKKPDEVRKQSQLVLFGKPILTEQQISISCCGRPVLSPSHSFNSLAELDGLRPHEDSRDIYVCSENGQCKVFMESEDVGRTLDLTLLGSYDELCKKLEGMFGIEESLKFRHILCQHMDGVVKHIGHEPFSDFVKTARRLTISICQRENEEGMAAPR
ncbi:hypothetical protein MLD38_032538 [Melastoma candidum]|uniref:Uncharacterized protein n=1 Tax=Melastoma candidum TaxID=119954 RepID=A0ACB9M5R0_9MYRT|nr:hypothetical protein MLD38_032538 [Melastoma candidum]